MGPWKGRFVIRSSSSRARARESEKAISENPKFPAASSIRKPILKGIGNVGYVEARVYDTRARF